MASPWWSSRPHAALAEAAECDAALAGLLAEGRPIPPFFGVPCTVKENFAVAGMPHTSGLVCRRGALATCDATAVARLRAAGFVVLGVTNLSELCMWCVLARHGATAVRG